jgi:hypothetical protein
MGVAIVVFLIIYATLILLGYTQMNIIGAQMKVAAIGGLDPNATQDVKTKAAQMMMPALVPWASGVIVAFFLIVLTQVTATLAGWEAINGRRAGVGAILSATIRRPFWMSLIQTLILMAVLFLVMMVLVIIAFPFSKSNPQALPGIIFGIGTLVYAYPVVATAFRIHRTSIEGRGPWQGMIASIALVKGYWWRTFGILFLFLIASTALTSLGALALGNDSLFNFSAATDPSTRTAAIMRMHDLYTWGYILASSAIPALVLTILFYLLTPMYVDLRARHHEFLSEEERTDLLMMEP